MLRERLVTLAVDESSAVGSTIKQSLLLEYVSEQATLLHFIAAIMDDKDATAYVDVPLSEIPKGVKPPLLMPQEVLAFIRHHFHYCWTACRCGG